MPPSTSATIPKTISNTPMSFTSTSGSARLHSPGQPPWLAALAPKPDARLRLICVPHAGGAPSAYLGWARALEEQPIEVVAAHLPGRETREHEMPPASLDV